MRSKFLSKVLMFFEDYIQKKYWKKTLLCLSAIVVFCTVYALILPAITMEATCGIEEHIHGDSCYELKTITERVLACSAQVHEHAAECKDEEGNITCGYADFVVHSHNDDCYKDDELVCTLPVVVVHTHTAECSSDGELTCELKEAVLHTHGTACYDEQGALICTSLEVLEHTHDDSCFAQREGTEEKVLICESVEHTHSDICYPEISEHDSTEFGYELIPIGDTAYYTLKITGEGVPVPDNFIAEEAALQDVIPLIKRLEIGEGITEIGASAFVGLPVLEEVSIPSTVTSIGEKAFYNLPYLTKLTFAPNSQLKFIKQSAFSSCITLESVIIPASVEILDGAFSSCLKLKNVVFEEGSNIKTIDDYTFYDCSLISITIPESLETIGYRCVFCNTLSNIEFEENSNLKVIGERAFQNSKFKSITIPASVESIGLNAFLTQAALEEIKFEEGSQLKTIANTAFQGCKNLKKVTIPASTTSIGNALFSNCFALETVVLEGGALKSCGNNQITAGMSFDVVVKNKVESLHQNFIRYTAPCAKFNFEGPNDIVMPDISKFADVQAALREISGNCYVDSQGVLYELNSDGTATLAYVSPNLEGECTIPETITTVGGVTYNITAVAPHAFRLATGITALTVEKPDAFTNIADYTFAYLPKLSSVNSETSVGGAEGLFVSAQKGVDIFTGTALTDEAEAEKQTDEKIIIDEYGLKFTIETMAGEKGKNDNGVFLYETGDLANVKVTLSPVGNEEVKGKVARLYAAFETEKGSFEGQKPGNSYSFGDYTAALKKTDALNVIYWEFSAPADGEAADINLFLHYPSPSSPGGYVKLWGVIVDENSGNIISSGDNYQMLDFYTERDEFSLTKSYVENSMKISGDENNMYVDNMSFNIQMTLDSTTSDLGKDYMKSASFKDVLDIPDNVRWREDVLDAIRNGYITKTTEANLHSIYVTVDGEQLLLCKINNRDYQITPKINETTKQVELYWTRHNYLYLSQEMLPANDILTFGNKVLEVIDAEAFQSEGILAFNNTVTVTQSFSYSSDYTTSSSCSAQIDCAAAELSFVKQSSINKGTTWLETQHLWQAFGGDEWFRIQLSNVGALPYENLDYIQDTLSQWNFISGLDLQYMFDDDDDEHMLKVTLKPATLCKNPSNYTVTGTDNREYKVASRNTGADGETDYDGRTYTDSSVITTNAVLTFAWIDDVLTLNVSYTEGEVNENFTKTVGAGQDYEDVQSALDAVGYIVTRAVQYDVVWDLPEGFKLYAAQEEAFIIRSTSKTTFMRLANDTLEKHSGNSTSTNTAYIFKNDSTTAASASTKANPRACEISLLTQLSVDGKVLATDDYVQLGDVLDYAIDLYAKSGYYYMTPIVEQLKGGQVLMVPVDGNSEADWVNENTVVYTEDGIDYYLLTAKSEDEPTTYYNVYVGGMLADRVIVGPLEEGGLTTRIYWYRPYIKTPDNGNHEKIYIKALVDTELSNIKTAAFSLISEVWLNDHETHRLWDKVGSTCSIVEIQKDIVDDVVNLNDTSDDILHPKEECDLTEGIEVTYRLTMYLTRGEAEVSGQYVFDKLPKALGNYWDKATNIKIEYSHPERVTNGDDWTIENTTPQNEKGDDTQQYIRWDNTTFDLSTDWFCIYVTLTYPKEEAWIDYVDKYSAESLDNTFFVYSSWATVYQAVSVETKAMLQKGVYSSGACYRTGVSTYYRYRTHGLSRLYYVNDTADLGMVIYYVNIANTGKTRLYLEDIQDVMPEGFTFGGVGYADGNLNKRRNETGTGTASSNGNTPSTTEGIKYKNLNLSWKCDYSGENPKVTFSFPAGSTACKYDSHYEKYYLLPGEGISFPYYCWTNEYKATKDTVNNSIAMSHFNYNGAGIVLDTESEATLRNAGNNALNDGERYLLTNSEALTHGFTGGKNETQWLYSAVTSYRGSIVPGITKKVESLTRANGTTVDEFFGALNTDTVNWLVTASNTGNTTMDDYTIVDVMQKPYSFVIGTQISYVTKDKDGNVLIEKIIGTLTQSGTGVRLVANSINQVLSLGEEKVLRYHWNNSVNPNTYHDIGVKISINEQGNEVLSLHFIGDHFAIPAGGTGELRISTKNPTTVYNNTVYYNTAYLIPEQSFGRWNSGSIDSYTDTDALGETVTRRAVRNSNRIVVSYGAFTSSEKTVTETLNPNNTANSEGDKNYIVLPDEKSGFRYNLSVTNITGTEIDKMVLIDNLPHPDDHNIFVPEEKRDSDFKVSLAQTPDFSVVVRDKDGNETVLDSTQYTIEYSTLTEFTTDADQNEKIDDWEGKGDSWTSNQTGARSLRLKVNYEIPDKATVTLGFNAGIEGEKLAPGSIAWNSFGYCCTIEEDGIVNDLMSTPLKVGVMIPYDPYITKKLENSVGGSFNAEQQETFGVIIYEDEEIKLNENFTASELAEILADNDRKFTYIELDVAEGKSFSESLLLKNCTEYSFNTDTNQWEDTGVPFVWEKSRYYTMVELPVANEEFSFDSMGDSISTIGRNTWTFLYTVEYELPLTVINKHHDWSILVEKYSSEEDEQGNKTTLTGALFGLYSQDVNDLISSAEYLELTNIVGRDVKQTITKDDITYYLSTSVMTNENGVAQFDALSLDNDKYVIAELMAPSGYVLDEEPEKVLRDNAQDNLAKVAVYNDPGMKLPETGGTGIAWYSVIGSLMICAAVCLCVRKRKRRIEFK